MRETETRINLPLTASGGGGCSCCAPVPGARPEPAEEDMGFFLEGLTCGHCVRTVEKAVTALAGVESASVELVPGGPSRLTVAGTATRWAVEQAVTGAGYSIASGK